MSIPKQIIGMILLLLSIIVILIIFHSINIELLYMGRVKTSLT